MKYEPEIVEVKIIYIIENLLSHILFCSLGLVVSFWISDLLSNSYIIIIGIIIFLLLPSILAKKIRALLFRTRAVFVFYDTYFELKQYGIRSNVFKKAICYNYTDISAAKVQTSATMKYSYIDMYFLNGKHKKYIFEENNGQSSEKRQSSSVTIFKLLQIYKEKLPGTNDIASIDPSASLRKTISHLIIANLFIILIGIWCWFNAREVVPFAAIILIGGGIRAYNTLKKKVAEK